MPGGVNSPVRAFRAVGCTPRVIGSGDGCHLVDVDGHRFIDYIGSFGPLILGHAYPLVVEAVHRAVESGTGFGALCQTEIQLAKEVVRRVASIEMVRFVNSGTEAVMSAIRLARAATGRNRIVKFSGCYHGHADSMLVSAGSGVATLGLPDSPGVTRGATQDTNIAVYNDVDSVSAVFDEVGSEVAAVIVEPIAGNMGVVPPAPGFLEELRRMTNDHGALLIFDEVMTGFRVGPGGAQALFDVSADLTVLGKIIGGGFPVGAYGGPSSLMERMAPSGPVYQAGTLSGNPVAMAAGLAVLLRLDGAVYGQLERMSAKLASGLLESAKRHDLSVQVQRAGSMLTLFFCREPVRNFSEAKAADHDRFAAFFRGMLEEGVMLPPSGYEAWFVSTAHGDGVIEQTLVAADRSFSRMVQE